MNAGLPRRHRSPRRLGLRLGLGVLAATMWLKIGTMLVAGLVATGAYAVQDYPRSERVGEFLLLGNVVESHTAQFNLGTARAAHGDLTGARDALRTALELTPAADECPVRLNLGLVLEALAARQTEAGQPEASRDFTGEAEQTGLFDQAAGGRAPGELRPGMLDPGEETVQVQRIAFETDSGS